MHEMTTFEQQFADRLQREVSAALPAFDAGRIARSAMTRRRAGDRVLMRLGLGNALPLPPATRRLVVGLVAAALVLMTIALAVGLARMGGDRLALVRTNGDLVVANADGSGQRIVGHMPISSIYLQVAMAPNGSLIAFVGDDQRLTIVDTSGRVAFERPLDQGFSHFAWSPDGARLALLDGAWLPTDETDGPPIVKPHLNILAIDGTLERVVALPDEFRYVTALGAVAWSPDGRQLAITGFGSDRVALAFPSSIWIVDLASGAVREIAAPDRTSDFYPRWLPNGRILFSRQNSGIWQLDPATGNETLVYTPDKPWNGSMLIETLEPSPDGTRVAFIAPNIGLGVLDLTTGVVTTVTLREGGGMQPVEWSPDGNALVTRWGPVTSGPFWPTSVGLIDVATGQVTVLGDDVYAFDVRH